LVTVGNGCGTRITARIGFALIEFGERLSILCKLTFIDQSSIVSRIFPATLFLSNP
jgi:hypothetical protein